MYEFEEKLKEEALLRSLSKRTYEAYFNRLRRFYNYFQKPLYSISLQEIRDYFLDLMNNGRNGKESIRNARYAIRFYYIHCLKYEEYTIDFVKVKRPYKLPVIITHNEVKEIISKIKVIDYKVCLELIYCCGLRISEAINIRVKDIVSNQNVIIIRNSKGCKDRAVPIPNKMLSKLREYWKTHKNRVILFPTRKYRRNFKERMTTQITITSKVIQDTMREALKKTKIHKHVTPHTFRHCFALHFNLHCFASRILALHCVTFLWVDLLRSAFTLC